MRGRLALLSLVSLPILVMAACATNTARPAGYVRPEVLVRRPGPIFFGSGNTAPVTIDVQIANSGSVPIVVRRVRIESPGMSQYTLRPVSREFRETIISGQLALVSIQALAYTPVARSNPSEPLLIRATVEMEVGEARVREVYTIRAEQ